MLSFRFPCGHFEKKMPFLSLLARGVKMCAKNLLTFLEISTRLWHHILSTTKKERVNSEICFLTVVSKTFLLFSLSKGPSRISIFSWNFSKIRPPYSRCIPESHCIREMTEDGSRFGMSSLLHCKFSFNSILNFLPGSLYTPILQTTIFNCSLVNVWGLCLFWLIR